MTIFNYLWEHSLINFTPQYHHLCLLTFFKLVLLYYLLSDFIVLLFPLFYLLYFLRPQVAEIKIL